MQLLEQLRAWIARRIAKRELADQEAIILDQRRVMRLNMQSAQRLQHELDNLIDSIPAMVSLTKNRELGAMIVRVTVSGEIGRALSQPASGPLCRAAVQAVARGIVDQLKVGRVQIVPNIAGQEILYRL